jgi:hypothetical protein
MKHFLRFNLLALFLGLPGMCLAVDVSTKLGFESVYVTYGTKYSEETWVPMIDVSQGDYYAGIWGYIPTHLQKSFEGEWDFFAGRTLKVNKLVSFDVGATVYQYPRTDVDATTLEGFLWLNLDAPLSPKLKLYYDVTVKNWIGEVMISHTFPLNKTTALAFEGHGGFRHPEHHKEWYYATAKADVVFTLSEKGKFSIGLRSTDNTDHAAVGHGLVNWYGLTYGYSW